MNLDSPLSVNPILQLFNPLIPNQVKRPRGRPKKVQPLLPEGFMKHALSDDEPEIRGFTGTEKLRLRREYAYETTVLKQAPTDIIAELAKLYGVNYRVAYDLVNAG